jgi:predicted enzyme related to lactoylglutathione lyase
MRHLVALLTLSILSGAAPAASAKPPKPDVGAGHVTWFDLVTTDIPKSKDFYGKLFGWTFTSLPGYGDHAVEIVSGRPIGTIRKEAGAVGKNSGVVYIQVDDMLASCAKARSLGGTIPEGFPFDLDGGGGSVALVVDPVGQSIGMYSRKSPPKKAK